MIPYMKKEEFVRWGETALGLGQSDAAQGTFMASGRTDVFPGLRDGTACSLAFVDGSCR